MRRARVYYDPTRGWVVRLANTGLHFDALAGGEFGFDEWTDALTWAVRMMGA